LIIYIVVNFSKKVETNFQNWTFLKMSKSEILEIVFLEENHFFSYAVIWFSCDFVLKCLFA